MAYIDSANIKGTLYELQDTQARTDIGDLKSQFDAEMLSTIGSVVASKNLNRTTSEESVYRYYIPATVHSGEPYQLYFHANQYQGKSPTSPNPTLRLYTTTGQSTDTIVDRVVIIDDITVGKSYIAPFVASGDANYVYVYLNTIAGTLDVDISIHGALNDAIDDLRLENEYQDEKLNELGAIPFPNLYDYSAITSGGRIRTDTGAYEGNANFNCSDYIEVVPGYDYVISFSWYSTGNYGLAFYDSSKTFIPNSGMKQANSQEAGFFDPFVFTAVQGAKYVRFSIPNSRNPATVTFKRYYKTLSEKVDDTMYHVPESFEYSNIYTEDSTTVGSYTTLDGQGICVYGDNIIYALRFNGSDSGDTMLVKYNIGTGNVVRVQDHSYGHANDIAYVEPQSALFILALDNAGTVYKVDPETLEYSSDFSLESVLSPLVDNYTGVGGVAYAKGIDKIIFLIRGTKRGFAFFDSAMNFEKIIWIDYIKNYTLGGISADDNFIYTTQYNGTTSNNKLVLYDYRGNIVSKTPLTAKNEPEGALKYGDNIIALFNESNKVWIINCAPTNTEIPIAKVLSQYYPF